MAISANKFKPSVTPETWMWPTNGCRMSTLVTAARYQSLDEWFTNPSGKPYTKTQRTKVMKRLREAASLHRGEASTAAKGYGRDDALAAYAEVFPDGKAEAFNPTADELKTVLRLGYFVSISGNTDDVPDVSNLDDRVNDVPHEIGLARLSKDGTKVLVYEPMRTDKPIWVKWEHIKKFASEFATNGRYVAIRFDIGWGTAEEQVRRAYVDRLATLRRDRNAALQEQQRLEDEVAALEDQVAALEIDVAESEWDDAVDAAVAAVGALRRG